MSVVDGERNRGSEDSGAVAKRRGHDASDRIVQGALIDVFGSPHRMLAEVGDRVLLLDLRTHHVFLTQDLEEGSIQLPTIGQVGEMITSGVARLVGRRRSRATATARMRAQIDMLDSAGVAQGDKAIWIHLAANWTADLATRFGPHDEPWKIRRWRAALRRAEAARSGSLRPARVHPGDDRAGTLDR